MSRATICFSLAILAIAFVIVAPPALAERSRDDDRHRGPVYQRHAFEWMGHHDARHGRRHGRTSHGTAPQVNAGWFQRPYPYHLDYYKMRYGGSYAPYFGNLYGPPQVVTAPPYYGPYYGGGEFGYPHEVAYPGEHRGYPNGVMFESPIEQSVPKNQSAAPTNGDSLPAP